MWGAVSDNKISIAQFKKPCQQIISSIFLNYFFTHFLVGETFQRHAHIIHKYLRSENSFVFFSGLFSGFFAPPAGQGRAPRPPGAARRAKAFLRRETRFFRPRRAFPGRSRALPRAGSAPGRCSPGPGFSAAASTKKGPAWLPALFYRGPAPTLSFRYI